MILEADEADNSLFLSLGLFLVHLNKRMNIGLVTLYFKLLFVVEISKLNSLLLMVEVTFKAIIDGGIVVGVASKEFNEK